MSEKEVSILEEFLLPFALKRFSLESYHTNFPLAQVAKAMAKSVMGNILNEYVTWLVRAFVRVLYNTSNEIYLKDLAAVTLAEASYMAGIGPFGSFKGMMGTSTEGRASMELITETEIHAWMLYLQENDKLPGVYQRFEGKYYLK
ncbi:MAG: hypothetical protein ACTSSG_03430 [Candidatus Heimdallarchaeaceae archaeon]